MREILKKVQVNMPFTMLVDGYLDVILKEKINPEVGLDCFALDRYSRNEFRDVADLLHGAELSITLHAPFFDLRPGAIDRKIRDVTIERLRQVFDLVPLFRPRSVVCHAAFDERYYVSNEDVWLENSRDTWSRFVKTATAAGTKIAIENVYETSPKFLSLLLGTFKESQSICFCFDTGHFNAFSQSPLEEWMNVLGSRIGQIHLHDNNGVTDEHNPVGEGTFPFLWFFELLKRKNVQPIITLEPHTEENLWRTLEGIKRAGLLDYLGE
ncbi:MAG: sugar phosphate isomerase/epimerase [Syntrophobacterales bacterium]|nr:sugar phosphate isomerase/epimerase [Syntrophobacterales bacterium]